MASAMDTWSRLVGGVLRDVYVVDTENRTGLEVIADSYLTFLLPMPYFFSLCAPCLATGRFAHVRLVSQPIV